MKTTKKIVPFTIIIMMFFMLFATSIATDIDTADYNPDSLSINSQSAILIDADSGKILYSKNAYTRMYPASTTKLMTAILTLENCNLTDVATVSHNAVYSIPSGYSHANLVEGEELTIEELLNVLLIPSANDAAIVLAEHIAGSVEAFSEMMNEKAKSLGCLDTNFVNPNGIHDENHYSTAYDLSLIGQYAMKFDDILRIAAVTQYTLPQTNAYTGEERIFNNTNTLINPNDSDYYEYATGLKTGYTDKSGSCIVASATKNNVNIIAVTLGSETSSGRREDCVNLFNYAFNHYSYKNIIDSGELVETVIVDNATAETETLNILAKSDINILLKNSVDVDRIEKTIEINDNLVAPIAQDAVVGTITYTVDGETYSTELIAETAVEEYKSDIETLISRAVIIILVLLLFILFMKKINKPKRKHGGYYYPLSNSKRSKKRKKSSKSKKGGRYKFSQINEYL